MRWIFLLIGIGVGAVTAFVGVVYWDIQRREHEKNQLIVFAPKNYHDTKALPALGDGFVGMSGTLSGAGVRSRNNQYSVACIQERKECVVAAVEQIGPNQVGRMEAPAFYPITKWTKDEIVAEEDNSEFQCQKVTITIDRRQEVLLWVLEPIKHTRPNCRTADTNLYKWTIDDDPTWKRLRVR